MELERKKKGLKVEEGEKSRDLEQRRKVGNKG